MRATELEIATLHVRRVTQALSEVSKDCEAAAGYMAQTPYGDETGPGSSPRNSAKERLRLVLSALQAAEFSVRAALDLA
jgi:hypothetical protein